MLHLALTSIESILVSRVTIAARTIFGRSCSPGMANEMMSFVDMWIVLFLVHR